MRVNARPRGLTRTGQGAISHGKKKGKEGTVKRRSMFLEELDRHGPSHVLGQVSRSAPDPHATSAYMDLGAGPSKCFDVADVHNRPRGPYSSGASTASGAFADRRCHVHSDPMST